MAASKFAAIVLIFMLSIAQLHALSLVAQDAHMMRNFVSRTENFSWNFQNEF
jgi:hypothetical protein